MGSQADIDITPEISLKVDYNEEQPTVLTVWFSRHAAGDEGCTSCMIARELTAEQARLIVRELEKGLIAPSEGPPDLARIL